MPMNLGGCVVDKAMIEKGQKIRSEVLGPEYVARAMAGADEFGAPMQDLVAGYCWGAIWGRDGLSRRDRSVINIAMLSALNRPHELKTHIKAAIGNGVTKDEIREILLQVTVYCGVPAGVDSFRVAREALQDL